MGGLLLQHLGIEPLIDLALMGRVSIGLERGDQSAQTRREDNEITSVDSGDVRVGDACRHEYRYSGTGRFRPVIVAKNELALQDMPRFVVGVVDVERGRAASAPLMDLK